MFKTLINIIIDGNVVGQVQNLEINQTQSIEPVSSGGMIPGKQNISGKAYRVRFSNTMVKEAFSEGRVHRGSQRLPFDIEIIDEKGTTVIHNAWIGGMDYNYIATDWQIVDSMTWEAESMSLQTPPVPAKPKETKPMLPKDIIKLSFKTTIEWNGVIIGKCRMIDLHQEREPFDLLTSVIGNCAHVEFDKRFISSIFVDGIVDASHQKEDFDIKIVERFAKAGAPLEVTSLIKKVKVTAPKSIGLEGVLYDFKKPIPKMSWIAGSVEHAKTQR